MVDINIQCSCSWLEAEYSCGVSCGGNILINNIHNVFCPVKLTDLYIIYQYCIKYCLVTMTSLKILSYSLSGATEGDQPC